MEEPELSDALRRHHRRHQVLPACPIDAGVHLVQLFDSWAGSLSRDLHVQRILPHMQDLLEGLKTVCVTVFAKGGSHFLGDLATLPCTTLGLDWQTDCRWARPATRPRRTQSPARQPRSQRALCQSWHHSCRTHRMIDELGIHRTIANLGHGLYPDIPLTTAGRLSKR